MDKGKLIKITAALVTLVAATIGPILLLNQPSPPKPSTEVQLMAPLVIPTPGTGAATVYEVVNPNAQPITVYHVITNTAAFLYAFTSTIPSSSTLTVRLKDIAAVPSPFDGSMTLTSTMPFTASVVGYDYPPTATPTVTPTSTNTPAPTQTATATVTATPTVTPTPTATPVSVFIPQVVKGQGW